MTTEPHHFFTPVVGRFVSGDHLNKRTKDNDNRPIEPDKQRIEVGVAFEKQTIWPFISGDLYQYLTAAYSGNADATARLTNWFSTMSGFSMKITDGDKPNSKGQVNENTKGHFVFWFQCMDLSFVGGQSADALVEIDGNQIKRGDYVQVAGSMKPNMQPGDRVGAYLNGYTMWKRADGAPIAGGVDPTAAFGAGGAAAPLPTGATPYDPSAGAGAAFGAPGMPQQSAPAQPPAAPAGMPGMPGATAPAPAAPQTASPGSAAPAPHPGILTPPPLPGT